MDEKKEILNWEQINTATKFGSEYTEQERAALTKVYEENLTPVHEYEVVKGTIVGTSNRDVIINIGSKSDGLVSINEFRDTPELNPGDEVEVYIEEQENAKGQLILSRRKAKLVRAWEKLQDAADNEKVLEALIKRRTKGGLIADVYGIEAFLPGSHIDVKPVRDFDAYVGKTIDVAVVRINYANDNVVVSHKVLIEKSLENQKLAIIGKLEKGQILEGTVKNITKFGAFIELGGIIALLHVTDFSWRRILHPEDVLELGQKVNVVVIDFDEEKKRVSVGMKQLTPHPWETLPASVQVGSKVKGKVVNLAEYGAFLELMPGEELPGLEPGIEGLIHLSEMSRSQYLHNIQDLVKVGDEIEAVVLTIDREEKKMSLGIKQLTSDPWESKDLLEKYSVGTKHEGIVRNLKHFGAFIELEEGVDGLLHVSALARGQKISHPSEILNIGDKVEIVVLEIDKANRRLALGLKQSEENLLETYGELFQLGSTHKGTITKKTEKGVFTALAHGIEGFVPKGHLTKENGQEAEVGEELDFQVLEFSKVNKKILLSHTATFSSPAGSKDKPKSKATKNLGRADNFTVIEKTTLGDIEALANLKKKISGSKVTPQELEEHGETLQ